MKKEVSIVALLLAAVLLFVYLFNLQFTGFVVSEQQTDFSQGTLDNVIYDSESDILSLNESATSGTYTSITFDAGESVTWNNLTYVGEGDLTFQVRACSDVDCSNETFETVNLENLELVAQYFQYIVSFEASEDPNVTTSLEDVTLVYSVSEEESSVSIEISNPVGGEEYESNNDVSFEFSTTGTNVTCLYTLDNGLTNESVENCESYSTDLDLDEGEYTITVYASGVEGDALEDVSFTVVEPEENEESESSSETESTPPSQETFSTRADLSASSLSDLSLSPGDSSEIVFTVTNNGDAPAISCSINPSDGAWISSSEDPVNVVEGSSQDFTFTVAMPEGTSEGQYNLGVSLECLGGVSSPESGFLVEFAEEKLGLEILDAQRTSLDNVRVIYTLSELTGEEDQDVEITFSLLDSNNVEVSSISDDVSVGANETEEFSTNLEINESLNGTMTLSVAYNSQVYSSTVLEPITLGAPTGAAIFGGIGTGGVFLIVIVAVALLVVLFVVRGMRRKGKTLGNLFDGSSGQ